jgi:putative nucleotidyltransferase with HDIG domain
MTQRQEKILAVDDEAVIRKLLCQKLSIEGYVCLTAGNADQALEEMASNRPDLVILDINMPGKSGTALLSEIKATFPDTAVIMATAKTDTNTAIHCMKEGAYDYLIKPFNLDDVVLSVDRALEKKRLEHENRDYQQHLEVKVEEQSAKIRASFINSVTSLAYALEAKDKYTSGHSRRVTDMAVAIARKLNLPQESIEKIELAGLLHDIGKIGVREDILNKEDTLTDEEFKHVKRHCEKGDRILSPIVEDQDISRMVRHHHEHWDGKGYPDKLSGQQIPQGARVLAVADAYDAMTSERPYRQALNPYKASDEIARFAGSQFDPSVVNAFLEISAVASATARVPGA